MAAGLSLDEHRFEEFAAAYNDVVSQRLDGQEPGNTLLTDGELVAGDFNLDTARLLRDAGPWGQHFPEPVFDGEFELIKRRIVGEKHLKMRVQPTVGGPACDAIAFNQADVDYEPGATATLAYRLDVNAWQGRESVQLNVIYVD
jgi:single-stranded-DNA-specific exonuclease